MIAKPAFAPIASVKAPRPAADHAIRRKPIQGRSQDKVQRIIATTARLVDAMPFEAITMAAIAAEAGASFSSIYRFFPSKEAIVDAVAMASLDRLQALYEDYFSGPDQPAEHLIDQAIDLYVGFVAREPGFRALWIDGAHSPDVAKRHRRLNETVVQMAKRYAIGRLGFSPSADLDLKLAVAMEATAQLLRYAFLQTEFPQDRVIAELKQWLRAALLLLR
jgi:AcrR family transcriptional regulator